MTKLKHSQFAAFLLVAILLISLLLSIGGGHYAAAASDVVSAYESSNVLDDLQDTTIDGEKFDLSEYYFDKSKNVKVLCFIEFGYSFVRNFDDYGLYVYVYNPRGLDFTQNQSLNKISLRYGDTTAFEKYPLNYLNRSTKEGYEGLFYKFKIALTEAQRTAIFDNLDSSKRIYEVSEIELYNSGANATAYEVSNTYTYTGYAKGYGSAFDTKSTLTCTSNDSVTLSLDVHPTYYRPKGTHNDGYTRDTLHSVYFSVPNEIIEKYGEMSAVHATWLNAHTAPIFITGNRTIYDAVYPYLAQYINGGSWKDYASNLKYTLIATKAAEGHRGDEYSYMGGYCSYNAYSDSGDSLYDQGAEYDDYINYLNYIFYASDGDADKFQISAEKLLGWFSTFTERFGNINQGNGASGLISGKYSAVLFDKVDAKPIDVNIKSDETYKLTDNTVSDTWWNRLFGTSLKVENSYEMSAIQPVTVKDLGTYPDRDIFCDKFFIAKNDYSDFRSYVIDENKKDKTVYLFRYYQSKYVSHEVTEYERTTKSAMIGGTFGAYKVIDTNAYFAQEWAQLDFDIIDITCTKDDVSTIIGVVSSPIDIVADIEPPVSTTKDGKITWQKIIALIGLICIVVVVFWLIKRLFSGKKGK